MTATAELKSVEQEQALAELQELREKLQVVALDDGDDWMNQLIYGDVGAGKTHLLGTSADHIETSPLFIFDIEGGLKTLLKFPNKNQIERKKVRSMQELTDGYNTLFKSIKNGKLPYGTVGVDSLTELADLDMRTIMTEAYDKNPDKVDKDVPSQREWGKVRNHIRTIVRAFRDLPCNVIFTAQVGSLQEEGQPTKFFPGFAGKLRTEIPGFMDVVGYLYAENEPGGDVIRKLQLQGTRRIVAKDRFGSLGAYLENPTIPMMWELTKGANGNNNS